MQLPAKDDATSAHELHQQVPAFTSEAASFDCSLDFMSGYKQCLVDTIQYVGYLNTMAGRIPTCNSEGDATLRFWQVRSKTLTLFSFLIALYFSHSV